MVRKDMIFWMHQIQAIEGSNITMEVVISGWTTIKSHIESIWAQIRAKIKEIYHSMPHKNFLEFAREIEFKIKVSKLNADEKIGCFF